MEFCFTLSSVQWISLKTRIKAVYHLGLDIFYLPFQSWWLQNWCTSISWITVAYVQNKNNQANKFHGNFKIFPPNPQIKTGDVLHRWRTLRRYPTVLFFLIGGCSLLALHLYLFLLNEFLFWKLKCKKQSSFSVQSDQNWSPGKGTDLFL